MVRKGSGLSSFFDTCCLAGAKLAWYVHLSSLCPAPALPPPSLPAAHVALHTSTQEPSLATPSPTPPNFPHPSTPSPHQVPSFTATKLLWLKRNEPQAYAAARHLLLPASYINFWLTGSKAMEVQGHVL